MHTFQVGDLVLVKKGHYAGEEAEVVGLTDQIGQCLIKVGHSLALAIPEDALEPLAPEDDQQAVKPQRTETPPSKGEAILSLLYLNGVLDKATSGDDHLRNLCHEEIYKLRRFIEG